MNYPVAFWAKRKPVFDRQREIRPEVKGIYVVDV